ncbi:hypothetical protein HGRIS_013672 [Hohenbuehelia grisea]|uniref:WD40 repeat-like protein n=1 Tax=Hohenbuehelia grisea TaxID=104357 RepID=A0ABR3IWD5_9AGAR
MDGPTATDAMNASSAPTVASILGVKGALRVRPHGLSQKPHVILRRVELSDDSGDEEENSGIVYFSLFAQKRIEVKPGKEILVSIAGADGKLRDHPVLFEGDLLPPVISEEKKNAEEGAENALPPMELDVVPPKLRRRSFFPVDVQDLPTTSATGPISTHVEAGVQVEPSYESCFTQTDLSTASSSTQTELSTASLSVQTEAVTASTSMQTEWSTASVSIQAEPSIAAASIQVDTEDLIPHSSFAVQASDPRILNCSDTQTDPVTPRATLKDIGLSPILASSGLPDEPEEQERSLSPMELDSHPASPIWSPSQAYLSFSRSPSPTTPLRASSIASSSSQQDIAKSAPSNSTIPSLIVANSDPAASQGETSISNEATPLAVKPAQAGAKLAASIPRASPSPRAIPPTTRVLRSATASSSTSKLAATPSPAPPKRPMTRAASRSSTPQPKKSSRPSTPTKPKKTSQAAASVPPTATEQPPLPAKTTHVTAIDPSQPAPTIDSGPVPQPTPPGFPPNPPARPVVVNTTPTTGWWPYTNGSQRSLYTAPTSYYTKTEPPPDPKSLAHIPSGPMSNPLGIRPSARPAVALRGPPTAPKSMAQTSMAAAPKMPGSLKTLTQAPSGVVPGSTPTPPIGPKKKVVVKPGWQPVKQAWSPVSTTSGSSSRATKSTDTSSPKTSHSPTEPKALKGSEDANKPSPPVDSLPPPPSTPAPAPPPPSTPAPAPPPPNTPPATPAASSTANQVPPAKPSPKPLKTTKPAQPPPHTLPLKPEDFSGPWKDIEIKVSPQEVSLIERQVLSPENLGTDMDFLLRRVLTQLPLVPRVSPDDTTKQVVFSILDLKRVLEAKAKLLSSQNACGAAPTAQPYPMASLQHPNTPVATTPSMSSSTLKGKWKPLNANVALTPVVEPAKKPQANGTSQTQASSSPNLEKKSQASAPQKPPQSDGSSSASLLQRISKGKSNGTTPATVQNGGQGEPPRDLASRIAPIATESASAPSSPVVPTPTKSTPQKAVLPKISTATPNKKVKVEPSSVPSTPVSASANGTSGPPPPKAHPLPPKPPPTTTPPPPPRKNTRGTKRAADDSVEVERARKKRRVFIWPTIESMFHSTLRGDEVISIKGISFSHDGTQFAVCCSDKTIRIWRSHGRIEIARLSHNTDIVSVVWMKSDKGIVSLTDDGVISKWVKTGANFWQWVKILDIGTDRRLEQDPICMAYRDDRIAVSFPKTGVKVWLFSKGTWQAQRSILRQNVTLIKFVEDGEALLGGTKDGVLWFCEIPNGTLRALSFLKHPILHIDVSSTGSSVLVAHSTGTTELVNLKPENKGKIMQTYACKDHDLRPDPGFGAKFAANDQAVVFGDVDGCVLVWDKARSKVVYGLDHGEDEVIQAVSSFDLPPGKDGFRCIITGTSSGRLSWWSQPASQTAAAGSSSSAPPKS